MASDTFGKTIRALRMGYRLSPTHGAWIRISWHSDELIRVDVVPHDQLVSATNKVKAHVCWWETRDDNDVLDLCEPLTEIRNPDKSYRFIVNINGELVSK